MGLLKMAEQWSTDEANGQVVNYATQKQKDTAMHSPPQASLTIIRDRLGLVERCAQELHEMKQAQRHDVGAPAQQPQRVARCEEEKRPAKHSQMHAPEPAQHEARQANAAQALVGVEGRVASSRRDVKMQIPLQPLDLPHGLASSRGRVPVFVRSEGHCEFG